MREPLFRAQVPNLENMSDIKLISEIEDGLDDIENCINSALLNKNYKNKLVNNWKRLRKKIDEEDLSHQELTALLVEVKNFLTNESFFSDLSPEELEQTRFEIVNIVEQIRLGRYEKIGFGESADVFIKEKERSLCYKIITNLLEYERCNTVQEEAEMMSEFHKFKIEGVKIPVPYYSFMDIRNNIYILVMEVVKNSATLEDVINKNLELPSDFDIDRVFENLNKFFDKVNEAGRYHADFHDRNIMLNLQDGKADAAVIDFGKAMMASGSDIHYGRTKDRSSKIDLKSVENNKNKLLINLTNRR